MDVSAADILLIALGGAIGAVLRFSVGQVVNTEQFPWATFAVNILGTFFLALITFSFPGISTGARLFLFTGFFGAFTTMSTFSLETVNLYFDGRIADAAFNFILNAGLCVIGAICGRYAGLAIVG